MRPWRDYHRVREACLAAEQRFGLRVTAPADGTAAPRPDRAETEKAARHGRTEEPRVRLRREVRLCAVVADSTEDFLARVRGAGLLVRERYGEVGDLTGYAIAVPGDTTAEGLPVWYGGGRLAPDLTLPRLQRRWPHEPAPVGRNRIALIGDLRGTVEDALVAASQELSRRKRSRSSVTRWSPPACCWARSAPASGLLLSITTGRRGHRVGAGTLRRRCGVRRARWRAAAELWAHGRRQRRWTLSPRSSP